MMMMMIQSKAQEFFFTRSLIYFASSTVFKCLANGSI